MDVDTDRPTFLLVPGAWHGAWCWDPLREALDADGWRSHAVDLPSSNPPADRPGDARPVGMLDDAQAIPASGINQDVVSGKPLMIRSRP